jgi:DNA-binding MarR family transcriptional regulator
VENAGKNYGELKDELMHAMYRFKSVGRHKHAFDDVKQREMRGMTPCGKKAPLMRDVNMAELIFLQRIAERDAGNDYEGTWLAAMSEYLCISKAAVSQMLSSLEKKGYITRETNPENRREVIVRLTKPCAEQVANHQKLFDARVDMLIERFGEKDIKELIRLVNKLADIVVEAEV